MPDHRLEPARRAAQQEHLLRAAHAQSIENRREAVKDALALGVPADELAKVLGVTTRRIRALAEEGEVRNGA